MDQTHLRHSYDRQCRCNSCCAYEKQLQITIKNEDNGYSLTSGPNNIRYSEIGMTSPIRVKLDKKNQAA